MINSYFRDLLHTKDRQQETLEQLDAVLGQSCISCDLQMAGPVYECHQGITSFSPTVAEELFRCELSDEEIHTQTLSLDMVMLKKANIVVDNSFSQAHTLLQIHCADQKGLIYDIMRMLKDCNIKVRICIFLHVIMIILTFYFLKNVAWSLEYSIVSVVLSFAHFP